MKYVIKIPAFLFIVSISAYIAKAEATTTESPENVVEQTLSVRVAADVINILPRIQALWPNQPQAYETCVKQALEVLISESTDNLTEQASRHLFSNIAGNMIPSDIEDRDLLLKLKCELILRSLNVPEINDDMSSWLDIARVQANVRSLLVPDYVKQGGVNSAYVMQASSLEEAQREILDNRRKVAADRWHQELLVADRKMTLLLLNKINDIASSMSEPERSHFIDEIKSIARLNDDEIR